MDAHPRITVIHDNAITAIEQKLITRYDDFSNVVGLDLLAQG